MSRCDVCNEKVEEHKLRHYVQGHICKNCEKRVLKFENIGKGIANRCRGGKK